MTRNTLLLLALWLGVTRITIAGGGLELTIQLARDEILQNDLLLTFVTAKNRSRQDITFDRVFDPACGSPGLQIRYESGEWEDVVALGQGRGNCPGMTTLKPGESLSYFMLLAFDTNGDKGAPIFFSTGKYQIAVGAFVNGKKMVSFPVSVNVVFDGEVRWPDPDKTARLQFLQSPTTDFVDTLPSRSFTREYLSLKLAGLEYLDRPDKLPAWIRAKEHASTLAVDDARELLGMQFVWKKNYVAGYEELSQICWLSEWAKSYLERCRTKLEMGELGQAAD